MRALLIVGLSCVASIASAAPKPKAAMLGLEVVVAKGKPDKETVRVATELTVAVRTRIKAGTGPWAFAPGSERELLDEKLLNNCETEAPACMAVIGVNLGADILVYGKVEKKSADYAVSLKVLDVAAKKQLIAWADVLPAADAKGVKLLEFAKKGFGRISGAPAPSTTPTPTTASTPPKTTPAAPAKGSCDATGLIAKGDDLLNTGSYGSALVQYEAALRCGPNESALMRAFYASCKSRNMTKAKQYWKLLPADKRDRLSQICTKQSIDVDML